MKLKSNMVGMVVLCIAFSSQSLTLGRVRGAVLVGQQLDVVIPVQMAAGEEATSLCFEAEVFHGDTRQESSRVRVLVEAAAQAQTAHVRIVSSAIIDEPVVTVYLRTGCGQKTSRRYVLLADFSSDMLAPTAQQQYVTPKVALLPVSPGASIAASQFSTAAPIQKAKKSRVSTQIVSSEVTVKRSESKSVVAPLKRTQSQSRLRLDPLELLSDRVANIDTFMMFTPPEDAVRTMQKMQTLEADVKTLLASSAKNEASLLDMKARLQKAEAERFPRGILYGLMALVLACLTAIAYLWTRQRRHYTGVGDWWSGAAVMPLPATLEPEPKPIPDPVVFHKQEDEARAPQITPPADLSGSAIEVALPAETGVKLMDMSETDFEDLMQSESTPDMKRRRASKPMPEVVAQTGPAHLINSEEMLDIRQQAEFFVSLGQTDRAMRVLKKQIDEGDEPNPFVYLDLLSIFHSLGLKNEFQLLRKDFNLLFNGRVPEFALFKEEGQGLESYPEFLSRITSLWPTAKALEVIVACIYQDPWDAKIQSYDLAAFRDLLLLHAIVQDVLLEPQAQVHEAIYIAQEMVTPPRVLDLDLSDSKMARLPPSLESKAAPDAHLPIDMGNLIDFDLPEIPRA